MSIILISLIRMSKYFFFFFAAAMGLTACSEHGQQTSTTIKPVFDRKKVDKGFVIYSAHCQKCHGVQAKGSPDWRKPDSEGKYPPPPLNGSGHAWHHSRKLLKQLISDGTQPQGNMPAWKDKLSDEEIENVITWFQSIWPPQVYHEWRKIDQRAH